jgi:hypothetical protein
MMVKDLVNNVLPGLNKRQVENLLGPAVFTPDEPNQEYYSEFEPDIICSIGTERIFLWDHDGVLYSPESEELLIRFDRNGQFESWYIIGSKKWPAVVGDPGNRTYRPSRNSEIYNLIQSLESGPSASSPETPFGDFGALNLGLSATIPSEGSPGYNSMSISP